VHVCVCTRVGLPEEELAFFGVPLHGWLGLLLEGFGCGQVKVEDLGLGLRVEDLRLVCLQLCTGLIFPFRVLRFPLQGFKASLSGREGWGKGVREGLGFRGLEGGWV
jgi:hypothetical protein